MEPCKEPCEEPCRSFVWCRQSTFLLRSVQSLLLYRMPRFGSQPSSSGAPCRSYYIGRPVSAVSLPRPERPVAPII